MAIKRYFADKNNTITNAFRSDLTTRGTGSNMGKSDILETFSIFGQADSTSAELERVLIQFPTAGIATDRTAGTLAASGDWFRRPVLEARWDSTIKDDRGNFYTSSSLAPGDDNINTIYLYNFVRGKLKDIPGLSNTRELFVDLHETLGQAALTQCLTTPVTGGWYATGIYTASVCVDSTATLIRDVWYSGTIGDGYTQYHTGSIAADSFAASNYSTTNRYTFSVTNSQEEYYPEQTARFRFFAREKGWSPNIYTAAQATVPNLTFESASYQITRVVDDYIVVGYGTGSVDHTLLSYDVSGNYFDFDMSMLEPGYMYAIHLSIYDDAIKSYIEQPADFKFKVNKYEY